MDGLSRKILETFDRLKLTHLSAADLAAAVTDAPAAQAEVSQAISRLAAEGSLREAAGQYERTEFGRLQIAGVTVLTLLTREGCKLCHEALRQIDPLARKFGATLRIVDVDSDRLLRERYGNDIPVLFLGNREIARHRVHIEDLRLELIEAAKPSELPR